MTCSINIVRKAKPESECKYIEFEVESEPIDYYYDTDNDEEFDIQFILSDLYEKVGILKQRIERLEDERRG